MALYQSIACQIIYQWVKEFGWNSQRCLFLFWVLCMAENGSPVSVLLPPSPFWRSISQTCVLESLAENLIRQHHHHVLCLYTYIFISPKYNLDLYLCFIDCVSFTFFMQSSPSINLPMRNEFFITAHCLGGSCAN